LSSDTTLDTLFGGRLKCLQHRSGYRFSVDAVLLGSFLRGGADDTILDLGAGCGIVSLIAAHRGLGKRIHAVEIQPALAALAGQNVLMNDFAGRIEIHCADLRTIAAFLPAGSFDWVVTNPPYRPAGSGRQNPEPERAAARHELYAALEEVVAAAAFALRTKGRLAIVYPAIRGASLIQALREKRLEPKRLQVVYSYPGSPARLLLAEAIKGGGEELEILAPFYIYEGPEAGYSPEMQRCYRL